MFLLDVHAVLCDENSRLIVKTDHREYFQWLESQVPEGFELAARSEDYWADERGREADKRLFHSEPTFFERRFMKKRKPIHYLELRKC
jgi:tRNA G46 methylase TrmB